MRVRYTSLSLADLVSILDYVAEHSSTGAERVQRRIQRSIDLLGEHPGIGVQTADPDIRRLSMAPSPYLVFYQVTESEVIIHAIRHGARAPYKL